MSRRTNEIEPERKKSIRNFRIVFAAFFAGIAIGTYVETHHMMSSAETSWIWSYGRGAAIANLGNGAAQTFFQKWDSVPLLSKASKTVRGDISAYQTIEANYPKTGVTLRGSLLRILLLWSSIMAAIAYTVISVLESRKDG